jgi:hypothetical protein
MMTRALTPRTKSGRPAPLNPIGIDACKPLGWLSRNLGESPLGMFSEPPVRIKPEDLPQLPRGIDGMLAGSRIRRAIIECD